VQAALAVQIHRRQGTPASGASFDKGVLHDEGALWATAGLLGPLLAELKLGVAGDAHSTNWATIPPTENATTHVPIQMVRPSFHPRSFIITMSEAMQGTKSVMTIRATVT
jgi:hypothetical protein